MKINVLFISLVLILSPSLFAGNAPQMERLNRGLTAFKTAENQVFVSWRSLGTDPKNTAFNLYRDHGDTPEKLNKEPLTGATCFLDATAPTGKGLTYFVKPVVKGKERSAEGHFKLKGGQKNAQYLSIPLRTPSQYTPGDCSVGDLDGDGEYEIVVHMTGIGHDNSHAGVTSPPIFQAYKMDGTFLWEINLGINIREGAHYTQFLVYDFDGDGKAEMICKTADGTVDGVGTVIGDPKVDWRIPTKDGNMDAFKNMPGGGVPPMPDSLHEGESREQLRQRFQGMRPEGMGNENPLAGKIMEGPEFLTVFEGATGKALSTVDYLPARGDTGVWGDNKANRSDRYLAGVAYLDGVHPSAVMCRGYYARATLAAWDWKDGKLSLRWFFDSKDNTPGNDAYSGQGNHSVSVADVDRDGFDEIIYGSAVIDHNGKGLYSTGFGHGDAMHCSDLDPTHPGLEIYQVHEDISHGGSVAAGHMRDAATGKLIFGLPAPEDVGRGMCADIDPRSDGFECWSVSSGGLYTCKGQKISNQKPRSCNFGIWWDGTPDRELLDKNVISRWDYSNEKEVVLFKAANCMSINGSKATPNLSADLFGDWREEVIFRTLDNKELRIFSTVIPTDIRLTTLMHDPQYRCAISWQNVAYNQPPYPSYYIGTNMKKPKPVKIVTPTPQK
jgi:rhamnogalacturonan endolyase